MVIKYLDTPQKITATTSDWFIPTTDNNYFPVVHNLLKLAMHSIQAIIFHAKVNLRKKSDKATALLQDMADASKRNCDVRILLNTSSKKSVLTRHNLLTKDFFKSTMVETRTTNKTRLAHSKLIIIDNEITIIGSHNLSERSLSRNRETSLVINSLTLAKKFQEYFYTQYYDLE
jgi:hypothetical protein